MDFFVEETVTHPAERVVRVLLDELESVIPYMESIDDIQTVERDELEDGTIRILRNWQGSAKTSPALIRPFLNKETLRWLDDAHWFPSEFRVEWKVTSKMSKLFTCGGINYFEPHPERPDEWTRARLTGTLTVLGDKLPGVPTFLGRKFAPAVERFVVRRFKPNFSDLAVGLQRYCDVDKHD